jgi:predicted transcriptional regulator
MQSMQKSLQQQLEKIMQMMKQGDQGKAMQNELGKAISQQEAMHNMLQKMMNQGQVGSNAYETLKQADQLLDKVREDILRNNISNSTIERQKQIMTRLLEAEKAENERDLEEKRKSDSAKEQFLSKPNTKLDDERFKLTMKRNC